MDGQSSSRRLFSPSQTEDLLDNSDRRALLDDGEGGRRQQEHLTKNNPSYGGCGCTEHAERTTAVKKTAKLSDDSLSFEEHLTRSVCSTLSSTTILSSPGATNDSSLQTPLGAEELALGDRGGNHGSLSPSYQLRRSESSSISPFSSYNGVELIDTTMLPELNTSASFEDLLRQEQAQPQQKDLSISFEGPTTSPGGWAYHNHEEYERHQNERPYRSLLATTWHVLRRYYNYKLLISCTMWLKAYMIMAYLGGCVAYMHFPRTSAPRPQPLPDFGYDVIPYHCPMLLKKFGSHENVQSICLLILYLIILAGVCIKPNGRLILQQFLHLNVLVFLTRTTTVGVTGLPQPNPRCVDHQHFPSTYWEAVQFVVGRGFPPHACGDLVYSGHVACTLVCMVILHRHHYLQNWFQCGLVWSIAVAGTYFVLSCRSHYSVDVVLAFYFTYFLQEFYYVRSEGRVGGRLTRFIMWLEDQQREDRPEDDHRRHLVGKKARYDVRSDCKDVVDAAPSEIIHDENTTKTVSLLSLSGAEEAYYSHGNFRDGKVVS